MGDEVIEVVVEIPRGSRNKYEFDHQRGVMRLDRRLFTATVYPADYGFLEGTLAEDSDPLDALVLLAEPTVPGCHVLARPVGVFWMEDEKGPDAKIIAVSGGMKRDVLVAPLEKKNPLNSYASSTPLVADGRVFVTFLDVGVTNPGPNVRPNTKTNGQVLVAAYDVDGNEVWRKHVGKFSSMHGWSCSPIAYRD